MKKSKAFLAGTIFLILSLLLIIGGCKKKSCVQCTVKDTSGNSVFLDNQKCGSDAEIASYKSSLSSAHPIICGILAVTDPNNSDNWVATQNICSTQEIINTTKASLQSAYNSSGYYVIFSQSSSSAGVLDCANK